MAVVGKIVVGIEASTEKFQKGVARAQRQLNGFTKSISSGVSSITSPAKLANLALTALSNPLTGLTAGAAAAGYAVNSLVKHFAEITNEQRRLAESIGLSTQAIQGFQAAGRSIGAGGVDSGITALTEALAQARTGSLEAQDRFKALGLSIEDLAGDPEKAVRTVLASVANLKTVGEQQAALVGVAGNSAKALSRLTEQGVKGLDTLVDNHLASSDKAIEAYKKLERERAKSDKAMGDSARRLSDAFAPVVTNLTAKFAQFTGAVAYVLGKGTDLVGITTPDEPGNLDPNRKAVRKVGPNPAELKLQNEANLKVVEKIRDAQNQINVLGRDQAKIVQDVNLQNAAASRQAKEALVAKTIDLERAKIQQTFVDRQIEIVGVLNEDLGIRARIARQMQLATQAQRDQAFALEKTLSSTTKLVDLRKGSAGGSFFFDSKDLNDLKKFADISKAESDYLKMVAGNRLFEGLGGTLTPDEQRKQRFAQIDADRFLSKDQKDFAKGNANEQFKDAQKSFLEGLGKISSPIDNFKRSVEKLNVARDQGQINQVEYKRLLSDSMKSLAGEPKLSSALTAGSTELYDRLAKRDLGVGDKTIEKQIKENTGKSVQLLSQINSNLAKQVSGNLQELE